MVLVVILFFFIKLRSLSEFKTILFKPNNAKPEDFVMKKQITVEVLRL